MLCRPLAFVVAAVAVATASVSGQLPQFRAATGAVAVPVLVTSGGRPVVDLTLQDFELTDSGVTQELVALQEVGGPLDVSIVIQQTIFLSFWGRATFEAEIDEVRRLLGLRDRLEVVSSSDGGRVLRPLGDPAGVLNLPVEPGPACVTVYDAMVAVLMRAVSAERQPILIVLTDGEGGGGAITRDVALSVARRGLHAISVLFRARPTVTGTSRVRWGWISDCAGAYAAWTEQTRRSVRSISGITHTDDQDRAFDVETRERLDEFVELSGGRRLNRSLIGGSIAKSVKPAIDEARARYVLYYGPAGVPAGGWHPIRVSLRRPGRFEVTARPGYER